MCVEALEECVPLPWQESDLGFSEVVGLRDCQGLLDAVAPYSCTDDSEPVGWNNSSGVTPLRGPKEPPDPQPSPPPPPSVCTQKPLHIQTAAFPLNSESCLI